MYLNKIYQTESNFIVYEGDGYFAEGCYTSNGEFVSMFVKGKKPLALIKENMRELTNSYGSEGIILEAPDGLKKYVCEWINNQFVLLHVMQGDVEIEKYTLTKKAQEELYSLFDELERCRKRNEERQKKILDLKVEYGLIEL